MKTSRRFVEKADLQPNQGWLSLHESGAYGYNLANESRLNEVQNHLNQVEDKIRAVVSVPLNFARMTKEQLQELILEHLPLAVRNQVASAIRGELAGGRNAPKEMT